MFHHHNPIDRVVQENITEADFACPFRSNESESEIHFRLLCPTYNELRGKSIPRKYCSYPLLFTLRCCLLSRTGLCNADFLRSYIKHLIFEMHFIFVRTDAVLLKVYIFYQLLDCVYRPS